jgi:small subunit ribosomal protein S21
VIKVTVRHGEPPERLLQRFKRICAKEGIFKEVKKRRFYEKPSDRRRRRAKEAVREAKKALRRKARDARRR